MPGSETEPGPLSTRDRDLASYYDYVARIANDANGKLILNRSPEHASIIVEHLFRKAEKDMKILTGELYSPIYGTSGVRKSAATFLRVHPEAVLEILAEKPLDNAHPLLSALAEAGLSGQVRVGILPERLKQETPYHFAVADGRCYRLEPDKHVYEAMVKFGEPLLGEKLRSAFLNLRTQSLQGT